MSTAEASRLRQQIDNIVSQAEDSIIVSYTREQAYAVDAASVGELVIEEVRTFMAHERLLTLGTYFGKWVCRCSKGDTRTSIVQRALRARGFVRHLVEINVETTGSAMLTDGGLILDPNRVPGVRKRWQRLQ